MDKISAPTRLNGHEVLRTGPSRHGYDALTVLVERHHRYEPYVVATWSPPCGTEWTWGHYFPTLDAATQYFNMRTEV